MKYKVLLLTVIFLIILNGCTGKQDNNILSLSGMSDSNSNSNFVSAMLKPFENLKNYVKENELTGKVDVAGMSVTFTKLKDLETCLANANLRNEYKNNLDAELPKYYYIPTYCLDHLEDCAAAFKSQNFGFAIATAYYPNTKDGVKYFMSTGSVSGDTPTEYTTHVDLGNIKYNTANVNGTTIYWFTSDHIEKFPGLNTTYIWTQDGFYGYLVYAGNHKEDNFKLCNFTKRIVLK